MWQKRRYITTDKIHMLLFCYIKVWQDSLEDRKGVQASLGLLKSGMLGILCHSSPLHGPVTRYVKLQVAHAPGMPGTFSPAADFKGNRLLAIPACTTARAWRTCRDACRDRWPAVTGKTFPAFPAHAHPHFCVSGKRPIPICTFHGII